MRVTYVHQHFTLPIQAGGVRSYEIASEMARRGHDVTMVTSSAQLPRSLQPRALFRRARYDGLDLVVLRSDYGNEMSYPRRLLAFAVFAFGASIAAVALRADLVYATSTPLTVAIPALLARRLRGTRFVFEVRDLWPEMPIAIGALHSAWMIRLARWLERRAYAGASALIGLSPGMAAAIEAQQGRKVAVIPNGASTDLGHPTSACSRCAHVSRYLAGITAAGAPSLVYAGTLGRVNDVGSLLPVVARVRDAGIPLALTILGRGSELRDIQQRVDEMGLPDAVAFFNPVPKRCVIYLLSLASATVSCTVRLPEIEKNSANKFFDSLAAGRPIFLTHAGWLRDLAEDEHIGFTLPVDDPPRAAAILINTLQDQAWMRTAAINAERLGRTRFSWSILAKQAVDLAEQTAAGRPRG